MEDDTSTTDSELETNLEDIDVELEDIEVSEEDIASLDKDEDEESESEPEVEEPEAESEQPEVEAEEVDKIEQPSDEDRRAYNKQMAEQRIREKQMREADIKQKQQSYVAEADDDQTLALRQLQVDAYNNKVENNTNKLQNGYERAVKDFPILSDTTPEIKAEIDAAIDAFQALHVKVDSFGNPSDVTGDLYQYLQSKANSIQRLTQIGARKQVENKAKEKSKTLITPSRTPKESKKDPQMEAFMEEANRW